MTKNQNAFETTLTAQFGPSDLVAAVDDLGTLTRPCYMVIEPDSDTQREVVYFNGVFGASSFVTTGIEFRYLPGSAVNSGLTHPAGATVRSVILAQHLEDLEQMITDLSHSDLDDLTTGDPHTQYQLEADHNVAGSHDALAINAQQLQGSVPSDFAPDSHVGSSSTISGHPLATTGSAGFMSADDKVTLDDLVNTPGGVNSVSAGGGIDVVGTSAVTVSHENTSSAASINNGPAEHIDVLTVDTYGHVTAVSKQTMSASDIGAASTGELTTHKSSGDHDSRYYTEDEVDARLNVKLNTTNPDATGEYRIGGTRVLDLPVDILRGFVGATQAFGIGASICELGGVAFEPGTFTVEAHENGALRELVYTTKASSERFKQDIAPSTLNGGECLKWNAERFRYIKDVEANGDRAATREWYIAERIFDASGERFIIRDREGRIQNTDDRAMIADMVLTIQQLEDRITKLEAKLS